MSEPAVFGLIRDGQTRMYVDHWAFVFLHRELLFGPDDFEAWVTRHEEIEEWDDDSPSIVADYDRKHLVWRAETAALQIPRVAALYDRLLQAAWPGFEIVAALEGPKDPDEAVDEDELDPWEDERPATVREAARLYEEEDEDEFDDEDDDEERGFDDEEVRAWVTIVSADGAIRHRHLERLPEDLLAAEDDPLAALTALPPAEVPPEAVVAEGMWIDEGARAVGVWGGRALRHRLPGLCRAWEGWTVAWADGGYEDQCKISGPAGVPLKEAEALAKLLPSVLSTKRFDMGSVLDALGGGLKRTAIKATGCLLAVICLPLVIFGLVSGNWKAVLISIAITCGVVIVVFKTIERRVRKSFQRNMPSAADRSDAPPAAGPLDESERRRRIDGLLASAGLPGLAEVEPLFSEEGELGLLE